MVLSSGILISSIELAPLSKRLLQVNTRGKAKQRGLLSEGDRKRGRVTNASSAHLSIITSVGSAIGYAGGRGLKSGNEKMGMV